MPSKSIRLIIFIGIGLFIVAALYFLYDPSENKLFPTCPFLKLTSYECPGCGSQRAIHLLLNFNFKEAFFSNLLVIPALLLVVLLVCMQFFGGKNRFPRLDYVLSSSKFIWVVLVVIVLFGVGRNLF